MNMLFMMKCSFFKKNLKNLNNYKIFKNVSFGKNFLLS